MKISDTIFINASPESVWDLLFDIEKMTQYVPGLESIEMLDDKTYQGTLRVKVGPISARFNGKVALQETEFAQRIVALIQGDDRTTASGVKAVFTSTLDPREDGTELAYEMEINLRGRLAQFGTAVMGGTAKKIAAEFANNLRAALEK